MIFRSPLRWLTCGLGVTISISGCLPASVVVKANEERLAAMRDDIEALAADKAASDDSDCGFTIYNLGTCQRVGLVYSRAAVDEAVLLDKIREYNEFNQFLNHLYGFDDLSNVCVEPILPSEVKIEDGVCVAIYPTGSGS